MRNAPAVLVGIGLFLTGIALGTLYHNEHILRARELERRVEGVGSVHFDSLIDPGYMTRWTIALATGSTGAALTGVGIMLIIVRIVDRHQPGGDTHGTR